MRPLTFEKLSNELPDWWERIDSDPKWRSYSECVAGHHHPSENTCCREESSILPKPSPSAAILHRALNLT